MLAGKTGQVVSALYTFQVTNKFPTRPTREHFDKTAEKVGAIPAHLDEVIKVGKKFLGNDPRTISDDAAANIAELFKTHPDFTNSETGGRTILYFCFWAITEVFLSDKESHNKLRSYLQATPFPSAQQRSQYVIKLFETFLPSELAEDSAVKEYVSERFGKNATAVIAVLLENFSEHFSFGLQRSPNTFPGNPFKTYLSRMRSGALTMYRYLGGISQLINTENELTERFIKVNNPGVSLDQARHDIASRSLRFAQRVAMHHIMFTETMILEGEINFYEIPKTGGGYEMVACTETLFNLFKYDRMPDDFSGMMKGEPSSGCPMAYSAFFLMLGNALISKLFPVSGSN